jgi:hypothetical protein
MRDEKEINDAIILPAPPGSGAPPEAYSRVTNPERFAPLHDAALALVERLRKEFAADYNGDDDTSLGDRHPALARPSVSLTPTDRAAAPILVGFTLFPSLIVRFGRASTISFPVCGCDACGSDAAREFEELERLTTFVTRGQFREEIRVPLFGHPSVRWTFGNLPTQKELKAMMKSQPASLAGIGGSSSGTHIDRDTARELRSHAEKITKWKPWRPS